MISKQIIQVSFEELNATAVNSRDKNYSWRLFLKASKKSRLSHPLIFHNKNTNRRAWNDGKT